MFLKSIGHDRDFLNIIQRKCYNNVHKVLQMKNQKFKQMISATNGQERAFELSHRMALLGGDACPYFAPFLGFGGAAAAMIFSAIGAAYGTAKSGIGIAGVGVVKPEM